ncbi:beta-alanine transporter-like [Paramacrobiotus metropolitanus]|uniref:beta-alanine transporter-like n=1 Tax=Paramacrobiotus metropolitanus TaxID=2943436 RepID=UPI002446227C|nr:beta-alanine transporter-like [Paramacrobiotus metropolitanus]
MARANENIMEADNIPEVRQKAASSRGFDGILEAVGPFGRYQKLLTFAVFLPAVIPSGFLSMSSVFFAATPGDYWCALPRDSSANDSWEIFTDFTSVSPDFSKRSCVMPIRTDNSTQINTTIPMTACEFGYEYDRSVYESTVITEWDLVCDHHLEGTFTFTIFTLGGLVGPLIWGYLADRFGRRKGFFLCVGFQSVFAVLTAFAPKYFLYCICRFLVGMTTSASYTIPLTLNLEISGPKQRALICVLHSFAYSLGCLIFVGAAYFLRSWRTLALATAIPATIIYILIWKFFPESPRWLLSKNSIRRVDVFVRKLSRVNGKVYPEEAEVMLTTMGASAVATPTRKPNKSSPLDLVRTPNMRRKTLILVFLNICNKGVSLGLNFYAPLFSTHPHLGALLNTLVELPPYLFAKTALDFMGRRSSLFLGFLTGGITCLTAFTIPYSVPSLVLMLSLVAKFSITFTYLGSKLMEDELFPTVVRSEGHSLVSVLSSITTCGVPFIVDLGYTFQVLPLLIFGSLCIVAALAVFFLPETAYQPLPQTLSDGENYGKNMPWKAHFRFFPVRPQENNKAAALENKIGSADC